MKRILFVCLGNICRSSSAEEIMRTYIKQAGLEKEIEVDSAGILVAITKENEPTTECVRMPFVAGMI